MENVNQEIKQGPQILDFLLRPAVEYNPPQNKYWGVSFHEGKAYVVSGTFCICVEGFKGVQPEGEYFSFFEGKYTKIPYRVGINDIIKAVHGFQFVGKTVFPVTNFINRLDALNDTDRKKSRVVFTQTFKEQGDTLLKFVRNGQRMEFRHPAIPKPFLIDMQNSAIPEQFVVPGTAYRCKVNEKEDAVYVNVLEPYGKVRAGIIHSKAGFDPRNMEAVHKFIGVPQDLMICTNVVEPVENFKMPPIHLDATMLYDLLKVFLSSNCKHVEMHFGDDPNKHVMFRNVKANPDDLQITVYVATLNPFVGIQRR
jgi:hypothetical protein